MLLPVYPTALFNTSAVVPAIALFTALFAEVELMLSVVRLETVPPIDAAPDPDEMVRE